MVYLFLFAIVAIAFLLRNQQKNLQIMPFVLLAIFAALRYGFGNDYFSYYRNFHDIRWQGHATLDDPLFVILNKICPNFYIFIAVTSIIFLVSISILVMKNVDSKYVWVSVLIFVINPTLFLMNLSAIRQCLAMCLFIAATPFILKRKILPYTVLVLLAFFLHKSAIILLPMYFITDRPVGKRWVVSVIAIATVILILPDLRMHLRYFFVFFDESNYIHYLESSLGNTLRATILTAIYFIYILGNLHRLKGKDLVYAKLYLVGTLCGIFAYRLSIFTRPQMYFDIFSVIALPTILKINIETVPAEVDSAYVIKSLWNCANRYALPTLVFIIYGLRLYSFFTNPMWSSFTEYETIFSTM